MSERIRIGSDEITLCVTSEATGGALLVAEVEIPAGGGPPALHRHEPEEVYRVERGELAVYVEEAGGDLRRIVAEPGSVVHIAGGRPHTVHNESDGPVSAYVVFAPGEPMERFVRAVAELAADGPARPAEVLALAARNGIEITRPLASRD